MPLPLEVGAAGEEVRDLHRRLAAAGFGIGSSPDISVFGADTKESVVSFQRTRGLDPTGICDHACWNALVEASFHLGNRSLYNTRPMLRGDDIADLQARLSSLGFDAGRADGIFGPQTELAVADFQRNAGLPSDGVAGPNTIAELVRLSARSNTAHPVTLVRETEQLRALPRDILGLRIAIGHDGSAHTLVHALGRMLRTSGAVVAEEHGAEWSAFARVANEFTAEVAVAISVSDADEGSISFFETASYTSAGGRRLAHLLKERLASTPVGRDCDLRGMRHPVLRETRMPAILCLLGPPSLVAQGSAALASLIHSALAAFLTDPLPQPVV